MRETEGTTVSTDKTDLRVGDQNSSLPCAPFSTVLSNCILDFDGPMLYPNLRGF